MKKNDLILGFTENLREFFVLEVFGGMAGLLLIDIQSDFCPGGALAVAEGDQTVAAANALRSSIAWAGVFLSQDWHPAGHVSFASTHGVAPFSAPISITTPAGTTTEQVSCALPPPLQSSLHCLTPLPPSPLPAGNVD